MRDMELTESEKRILRRIGRKAYREMVKTVGKAQMAKLSVEHGKQGGRPPLYDPCPIRVENKSKSKRHRFVGDVCKCGQRKLTP